MKIIMSYKIITYTFLCLIFTLSFCKKNTEPDDPIIIIDPPPNRSVHDTNPTWSSVHNLIAYIHYLDEDSLVDNRARGIHLINPDGTNDQFFHDGGGALAWFSLDWAPDGSCLLVRNEIGLFKISYPDKVIDTLRYNIDPMSFSYLMATFSPIGDKILTVTNGGDYGGIHLMNSDGSDNHRIIQHAMSPFWIANDSIAYMNFEPEFPYYSLCITDTTGLSRRQLLVNDSLLYVANISADTHFPTRRIAIYGPSFDGIYPDDLGKMEPDWQEITLLTNDSEYPCFSPDGNQVVFTYEKKGYGGLYIINWDGTNMRQLTE